MDRRKFVAGLGTLAGGGALATGTGAFSSIEAERDIEVSVAEDSSGLLGIQPTNEPNGQYADLSNGDTLAINLTGSNDNVTGEGINTNATTTISDVFEVRNQGSQTVNLFVTPLTFIDASFDGISFEGQVAAFLVPQDPDISGVELTYSVGDLPEISGPFFAIKQVNPGDGLRFGLEALAFPESAIGNAQVDGQIRIRARDA